MEVIHTDAELDKMVRAGILQGYSYKTVDDHEHLNLILPDGSEISINSVHHLESSDLSIWATYNESN
jgi:hypothetical protein